MYKTYGYEIVGPNVIVIIDIRGIGRNLIGWMNLCKICFVAICSCIDTSYVLYVI